MRILLLVVSLLVCGYSIAESQQPPQRPQIETKQQADSSDKAQQKTESSKHIVQNSILCSPTLVCNSPAPKTEPQSENGGQEGTEFWTPFFGYRLKVTDTLVAAFTFLLFIATVYLYRATKSLVIGADKSANMAYSVERPYIRCVDIKSTIKEWEDRADPGPRWAILEYFFENYGKTPAIFTEYAHALYIGNEAPADIDIRKRPIFHQSVIQGNSKSTREGVVFEDFTPESLQLFNQSVYSQLVTKEQTLFFFGYANYDDIFRQSHRMRFCWFYDVEHDSFSPVKNKELNQTT